MCVGGERRKRNVRKRGEERGWLSCLVFLVLREREVSIYFEK
jgi:hypothetical protein